MSQEHTTSSESRNVAKSTGGGGVRDVGRRGTRVVRRAIFNGRYGFVWGGCMRSRTRKANVRVAVLQLDFGWNQDRCGNGSPITRMTVAPRVSVRVRILLADARLTQRRRRRDRRGGICVHDAREGRWDRRGRRSLTVSNRIAAVRHSAGRARRDSMRAVWRAMTVRRSDMARRKVVLGRGEVVVTVTLAVHDGRPRRGARVRWGVDAHRRAPGRRVRVVVVPGVARARAPARARPVLRRGVRVLLVECNVLHRGVGLRGRGVARAEGRVLDDHQVHTAARP